MNARAAGADALSKLSEQRKVSKNSDLNVIDVYVAEFREAITNCISLIFDLLLKTEDVRKAGADALLMLSKQGNISSF